MRSMLPVIVLFLSSTMWGLIWIPMKLLQGQGFEGLPLIAVGFSAVALALLPFCIRQYAAWRPAAGLLVLILVLGGLANLSFNSAIMYGDVVRVMVLFYLVPVWGVLGGRIFLGERIDAQRILSVTLALFGAFLILGAWNIFETALGIVDGIALAAGFFFAMNNIAFRATPQLPLVSKLTAMFVGCGGFAWLLIGAGVQSMPPPDADSLLIMIAMGFGWFFIATLGTQWGVTQIEAGRASVIVVMELVAAVVSAAWLGSSTLGTVEIIGVISVLLATVLEAWRFENTVLPQRVA